MRSFLLVGIVLAGHLLQENFGLNNAVAVMVIGFVIIGLILDIVEVAKK